ncbi:glucose PTS transporter subunit EIIB [Cohnella rhizosphaerae]|uniref:Glucose PTS transporter subunit EIIB n=1 Tax=Cohnella rhizosphaerae TaxID=1457232 RepID=A0A9X4L0X8_9BACL|nr:glucose PTS transporter subunit EIIB [Cohnella rhizosphaerae]MDG0814518.1 glucose PTS transporter subunit EIIB [Cohnella rhizosphaerae]
MTPGREPDDIPVIAGFEYESGGKNGGGESTSRAGDDKRPLVSAADSAGRRELAASVAAAFGGSANISSIDACITRLRLTVNDERLVDDLELKRLGALGVIRLGKGSVQAVFGMEAEKLKDQIKAIL